MKRRITLNNVAGVSWAAVGIYWLSKAGQEDGWWTVPVYIAGGVIVIVILARLVNWHVNRTTKREDGKV